MKLLIQNIENWILWHTLTIFTLIGGGLYDVSLVVAWLAMLLGGIFLWPQINGEKYYSTMASKRHSRGHPHSNKPGIVISYVPLIIAMAYVGSFFTAVAVAIYMVFLLGVDAEIVERSEGRFTGI